ncbi:MAG: hypothetical protein MPN21_13965 [Thermoanaerobaculia bacterium]|nr:hypothetical protein [Thermoanaerobaculia bacterium]
MTGVLSHELAHAMIDRATDECAPKWFHEGLAQLLEPGARQVNPYRSGVKPVAMPLVESVLRGFSESGLVTQVYEQAYWALRYVEREHGKSGIHQLLESFAGCMRTPEAFRRALKIGSAEFDRQLRTWAGGPDAPLEDEGIPLAFDEEQLDLMAEMAPGFGEAVEQKAQERQPLPKVGLARELPTQEEIEDVVVEAVQELMEEWYESYYSDRAAQIKKDLADLVLVLRGDRPPERRVEAVCRDISTMIVSLHLSGTFESIDEDVNRSLRSAYGALSRATNACARGGDLQRHLKEAEKFLQDAAYHLDKYGLKP